MSLKDIPFQYKYRSNQDRLYKHFYHPCLVESVRYDRAAGYFSSHSLRYLAQGLDCFLWNQGKIRLVANPLLSSEDLDAIEKGYKAKSAVIEQSLLKEIKLTAESIEDDTLNVLAWLIYQNQLEIKIATTDNHSIYHEKFGVFTDAEGNSIAFSGSANETLSGIVNNFEKIDVYFNENDSKRIQDAKNDFDMLWYNETKGLTVHDIPDSVQKKILEKRKDMPCKHSQSNLSHIEPRGYQQQAISAIKANHWQGILEMATGTGKTITSLLTANEYKKINKKIFLVIYAPFTHLIDQWKQECEKFGFDYVTLCYGSKNAWLPQLEDETRNYNIGLRDTQVVITTYKTAITSHFNEQIGKVSSHTFLIADECHYIGSKAFRKLPFKRYTARVGLSATPDRWWDESGTAFLKGIFDRVVYRYSLEDAIDNDKLTPYTYHPYVVSLTEEELQEYKKITTQIIRLYNKEEENREIIERLNRKRALLIAKAKGKIPMLLSLLKRKNIEEIHHTLIYCGERQVDILTKELSNLGLRVHKFDSTVDNHYRKKVLKSFSDGDIQVLVAIKCLDEGVDVPSTRVAYFLASTSNPREFVQRRGRILRNAIGKTMAEIHDFIVLAEGMDTETFTMIAKKELPRFAEFSSVAINQSSAKTQIFASLDRYHLNYLMDKKPWDVYQEMREEYENELLEQRITE